ncbi:monovalent cation/H+ antiporter subunit D family protein [Luteimonas vadosa]|uniref:Monovalent cation/H+ antiporter subunit D family protein n=1 Tax=Luteimonas vadosa TaxID=1165507 RepID=A0ABP9DQI4_9GAMM
MTVLELMPFSVLVPLIAAPVCALLPGRALPWLLAMACVLASLAITALVLPAAVEAPLSYAFGNWQPPIGIEYRVDAVNAFVSLLLAGVTVPILAWGKTSVDREVPERQGVFYALFLLCFSGLMGITLTGDAFNVFVFLEVSSLSTYALIALGRDRRALVASFRYLVMGTVGATFFLIGIGFLYMMAGTLNMGDLAERLPAIEQTNTVRAALAFIVVGLGLKMAMFPLHLWLPNAYTYAPSFVTTFLAATATKVALYVMLRFVFTVFSPEYSFVVVPLSAILMVLAAAGILAGSWAALFELNLKRMLAYSSVAQVGYMLLGVSLATTLGVMSGLLHLFNHALIKAAMFMALGTVYYRIGSIRIGDIHGLGRSMPWTFAAFALAGLSLVGVPLTAGFISKWYLILAVLETRAWWLVAAIVVPSLMAVVYVWRVVEAAWFKAPPADREAVAEAPLRLLVPLWVLVAANFYFGIDTRLTVGTATHAAQVLLGNGG